ncbi:MAG TPA: YciI family protein [Candidatus Angelobacter sp.]|nr:YciI family protein [Candidatus Angelobacter sp.]
MRYMLLIYTREEAIARSSAEEMQQLMNSHIAAMQEAHAKGVMHQAEPLPKTSTAKTVRMQNGTPIITDGPFAETKEQLAGYYILDCKDIHEAIAWAEKIPTGCGGAQGSIEIRALQDIPASEKVKHGEYSSAARNG